MVLVPEKSQSLLPSFKSKMLDHTGFPVPEVSPGLFPQQQLLLQFFLMMITAQIAQEQAALGTPRKEKRQQICLITACFEGKPPFLRHEGPGCKVELKIVCFPTCKLCRNPIPAVRGGHSFQQHQDTHTAAPVDFPCTAESNNITAFRRTAVLSHAPSRKCPCTFIGVKGCHPHCVRLLRFAPSKKKSQQKTIP